MAMKKFTPGTRSRRHSQSAAPPEARFEAVRDHIETQRSRLMDAEAVLDCMIRAMDDDLRIGALSPNYPSLVRIAREFVHSAIDQLDWVNVRAVSAQLEGYVDVSAETSGVKETPAVYVH